MDLAQGTTGHTVPTLGGTFAPSGKSALRLTDAARPRVRAELTPLFQASEGTQQSAGHPPGEAGMMSVRKTMTVEAAWSRILSGGA